MYAFTPDGKTVLFLDGFGFTRLALPKQVKTERKIHGSSQARLSVNASGTSGCVWDDYWDRTHLFDLPGLKLTSFDRFRQCGAVLLPDGKHLALFVGSSWQRDSPLLTITDLEGNETHRVELRGEVKASAPQRLGPESKKYASGHQSLVVAADGTFAAYDPEPGELFLGSVADVRKRPQTTRRIPLQFGQGYRFRLFPEAGGALVVAHDTRLARAFGLRVDAAGHATPFDVPCVAMPASAGGAVLAYQRTAGEVIRRDLDSGREEVFALPPSAAGGAGEVLAHGDQLLFVPWHGEAIVDLVRGTEVPRKLPPAELPVRAYWSNWLKSAREKTAVCQLAPEMSALTIDARKSVMRSFSVTGGDGSLLAALVYTHLFSDDSMRMELDGFGSSGYGHSGGAAAVLDTPDADAVATAFEHIDRHHIWLPSTLKAMGDLYERRILGGTHYSGESDGPPMTSEAERLFLRGLFAHLAKPEAPPPLTPHVSDWRKDPLTAEEAIKGLHTIKKNHPAVPYDVMEGLARMLTHHLGANAAPVLVSMLLELPQELLTNSSHDVMQMVTYLLEHHPEAKRELRALVEANKTYKHDPRWGGDRREELLSMLA